MLIMNLIHTVERERPISAVGVPGFISVLFGIEFSYWTISIFLSRGIVPRGLALVSTFLFLIGVLACFTAIILHSLNTQLPNR